MTATPSVFRFPVRDLLATPSSFTRPPASLRRVTFVDKSNLSAVPYPSPASTRATRRGDPRSRTPLRGCAGLGRVRGDEPNSERRQLMKWVLWIGAGIVLVIGLAAAVGAMLPKGHSATRRARYRVAPEALYAVIA